MGPSNKNVGILLVAADPLSTGDDYLDEERQVVLDSFKGSDRDVHVTTVRVVKSTDFIARLRNCSADVLQFTGHGSPAGGVLFEGENGRIQKKTAKGLRTILETAGVTFDGIVFNGCSVGRRPKSLLSVCKNVVSVTTRQVFDISLEFSRAFYQSWSQNVSFESASEKAIAELRTLGFGPSIRLDLLQATTLEDLPEIPSVSLPSMPEYRRELVRPEDFDIEPELGIARAMPAAESKASVPAPHSEPPRKYVVWYGTNRKPIDPSHPESGFGADRDELLHYGRCEVAVPKYHKIGSLGSSWLLRWATLKDDRLRVISRMPLLKSYFLADLTAALNQLPKEERVILLFIHGYNVTFDQAALRAAQMGFDLSIPGATAFFSWPSKGRILGYAADAAAVEASEDHLREYLEVLTTSVAAEHVHVIAHSMGNRPLLRVFDKLFARLSSGSKFRLSQIILAAADVDTDLFRRLAAAYCALSSRTTLYVSDKDRALAGSRFFHSYPRAGYRPPVTIVNGIDTIEVSNIDLSFLGHSYIAAARGVLHDIHSLLRHNIPPADRMGLESVLDPTTNLNYWRIRP